MRRKAHPQVRSVVNRFALMAGALRMAIAACLLPWTIKDADTGILACALRWAEQRGDLDVSGEVLRTVDRIRQTIRKREGLIRLRIDAGGALVPEFDGDPEIGFIKPDRILIWPEAWASLCGECKPSKVVQYLLEKDLLIPGETPGKPKKERIGAGASQRFYVLRSAFLKGNGEHDSTTRGEVEQ
jgi:hypothetical protein